MRANGLINGRIKLGKIVRPAACQHCDKVGKTDAHHPDYSRPEVVVFLCRRCHMKSHADATFEIAVAAKATSTGALQRRLSGGIINVSGVDSDPLTWSGIIGVTPLARVANLTNSPDNGDLTATMKASVATETQVGLTAQGVTTVRAGKLDNLDDPVSSRSTYAGGAADANAAAIKAKTDQLTFTTPNVVDASGTGEASPSYDVRGDSSSTSDQGTT